MSKAEREWEALHQVYRDDEFVSVLHCDRPDFVLRRAGANADFGVEVTELYETEADARTASHAGYISDLLAGGRHMHRDDVSVLRVERVELHDKDGNLKAANLPAIIRKKPSPAEHGRAIGEVLRRKTAQAIGYDLELSHVNLIIIDRLSAQRARGSAYRTNELLVPNLKEALRCSPFREVFLVSMDHDWRIYRPLQMLVLLEGFELFLGALKTFDSHAATLDTPDIMTLFVQLNTTVGLDSRLAKVDGDFRCVLYRANGIQLTEEGIRVLNFADHDLPSPLLTPPPLWAADTELAFAEHYSTFVGANAFVVELGIPVRT